MEENITVGGFVHTRCPLYINIYSVDYGNNVKVHNLEKVTKSNSTDNVKARAHFGHDKIYSEKQLKDI